MRDKDGRKYSCQEPREGHKDGWERCGTSVHGQIWLKAKGEGPAGAWDLSGWGIAPHTVPTLNLCKWRQNMGTPACVNMQKEFHSALTHVTNKAALNR